MFFQFQKQETLFFSALLCEDENVGSEIEIPKKPFPFLWEDEELDGLFCKEKLHSYGGGAREEVVKWMLKVIGYYGFHAMTALLAVNYYDRFIASVCFREVKPWMSQLAAVACLSIAAKVEETQVPLLLDLQVEESKYVFEAKTIQRMELLILSALKWNMNPVNPISFIDHIVRRFNLIENLHWEFLKKCENVILCTITDCRVLGHYLPSVIAAATIVHVIRDIGACDGVEGQIMDLLRTSKEEIDDCYKLIMEAMDDCEYKKQKRSAMMMTPGSPSGIIDANFSSVDSWAASTSSLSLSSAPQEPFSKRSRASIFGQAFFHVLHTTISLS